MHRSVGLEPFLSLLSVFVLHTWYRVLSSLVRMCNIHKYVSPKWLGYEPLDIYPARQPEGAHQSFRYGAAALSARCSEAEGSGLRLRLRFRIYPKP